MFLVVFGLLTLVVHALQRSASGRATLAVRSSEVAAEASGIKANRTKVMMFALSAAIAGFGGALLGMYSFIFSNTTAPPLHRAVLARARGDVRHPPPWRRAPRRVRARRRHRRLPLDRSVVLPAAATCSALIASIYFVPILSGLGAIQLAQEPDGILALAGQQTARKKREKDAPGAASPRPRPPPTTATVPEHERAAHRRRGRHAPDAPTDCRRSDAAARRSRCDGVVAGYGDAEVLHGVTLGVERGKVVALLGANGAGKSTLARSPRALVDATLGTVVPRGRRRHRHAPRTSAHARPAARARSARHLSGPHRRGEHRGAAPRPEAARQGVRAVPDPRANAASRSPACCRAASSRC